ncbi:MAG: alpha/beta hydrolase [Limisphaerales bacterium]
MFSFFTKLIDRAVIKMACAAQAKPNSHSPRCEEAYELLFREDLISAPVLPPKELNWRSEEEFEFRSCVSSPYPENDIVYAKLHKTGQDWQQRPTVVLIHGWNDEIGYVLRHPYHSKRFLKAGINVAMIELPFHLKRRPRKAGCVSDFLSEDLYCTVLGMQQAVMDIRSLLAWLRAQGCAETGLLGVSLGGWLTGLATTQDENVSFAVMNVPVARMDRVVKELPFSEPLRRSLKVAESKKLALDFEHLNLRSLRPKAPKDKILIIEAVDDLFACKDAIEEFWEAWGRPEIWRVNHAHISGLLSPGLLEKQVKWVREKTSGN